MSIFTYIKVIEYSADNIVEMCVKEKNFDLAIAKCRFRKIALDKKHQQRIFKR